MKAGDDCKAHPDEKGIETMADVAFTDSYIEIAKPIPMKRELKPEDS